MKTVMISASTEYPIYLGHDILKDLPLMLKKHHAPCRAVVVTDDTVSALYGARVLTALETGGYCASSFVFAHGESSKNLTVLSNLLSFCAKQELCRTDLIIALGGGVVGDLAGFAASIYLRGIPFIQLPTTFLAAVDSSVGGKTAVDLPEGKNLAGTFYQPEMVLCDTALLSTLPEITFADGAAEALKYGLLGDADFFEALSRDGCHKNIEEVIHRCITAKAYFVSADERDHGARQLLNLGHTFGHAIEARSDFSITHGHAVAIGMVMAARSAYKYGVSDNNLTSMVISALNRNHLPSSCPYSSKELFSFALHDKKRKDDCIHFIFPKKLGACVRFPIQLAEIPAVFAAACGEEG